MTHAKNRHDPCRVCRGDRNFKILEEKDIKGRVLMVCTQCGTKVPIPGQANPSWSELLANDP